MSFTRRSALALTGSGITAALAGVAVAGAQPKGALALIEAHRAALAFSDIQWDIYAEVTGANPDVDAICPKVQYSRMLLGRNDDGSDQFKPLFAYDEDEINTIVDRDLRTNLAIWGSGPSDTDARRAVIHAKAEARRERLKTELHRQQAELKAAEDACGMTAAHDAAKAASAIVDARLEALLAYSCADVSEVAMVAAYLVECDQKGVEGIDAETTFPDWVRALAGQAVQS